MQKHDTVTRMEEVSESKMTEICCNKCGKSSNVEYDEAGYPSFNVNKYQSFSTNFGYGSRYDCENWSFELCDDCLTDLIKTFKYSPSGFGQDGYYAHDEQIMFEKWKETGMVDLEAGMTKEEIAANGGSIYGDDEDDVDKSNPICCDKPMILNHRINNNNEREFGYYCSKCGNSEWDLED